MGTLIASAIRLAGVMLGIAALYFALSIALDHGSDLGMLEIAVGAAYAIAGLALLLPWRAVPPGPSRLGLVAALVVSWGFALAYGLVPALVWGVMHQANPVLSTWLFGAAMLALVANIGLAVHKLRS